MKRRLVIGIVCVILASACYGITPALTNIALKGGLPAEFLNGLFGEAVPQAMVMDAQNAMGNESVIGFGMSVAFFISLISCVLGKKKIKVSLRQAGELSLYGGGAFMATMLLISYAYRYLPAGAVIVMHFTYPVFVLVATGLFFKERFTLKRLGIVCLAILGVALISGVGGGTKQGMLVGAGLAIASGITYAVYFLAGRNASYAKLDASVSNVYITASAAIMCLAIAVVRAKLTLPANRFILLALLLQAVIGYVAGLRLLLIGIRHLGAVTASALNTLEPVFASITGVIVFGEAIGKTKGLGIAFVLCAAALSIISVNSAPNKTVKALRE